MNHTTIPFRSRLDIRTLATALATAGLSLCCGTGAKAAGAYRHQIPHIFQVSAKTGVLGARRIFPEHTINNNGLVAYVATVPTADGQSEAPALFYHNTVTRTIARVPAQPSLAFAETLGPVLQLNNRNQALVRRLFRVPIPANPGTYETLTDLDLWNLNPPSPVKFPVLQSEALIGKDFGLRGIYGTTSSLNNNGDFTYAGLTAGNGEVLGASQAGQAVQPLRWPGDPRDLSPRLADNGTVVFSSGGTVQLRSIPSFTSIGTAGSPDDGFDSVGSRPGISDNGDFVAFYGDLSNGRSQRSRTASLGRGIFLYDSRQNRIFRVAGIHGDGYLAPGEFYEDVNHNAQFDELHSATPESDIGMFAQFLPDAPVCVNNNGLIAFLAVDAEGRKGVYCAQFNPEREDYPVSDPWNVASVGEGLAFAPNATRLAGSVSDLALSDSLNEQDRPGRIAIWVRMDTGEEGIVVARQNPVPLVFIPGIAATDFCYGDSSDPPCDESDQAWVTLRPAKIRRLSLDPPSTPIIPKDVTRRFDATGTFGHWDRTYAYRDIIDSCLVARGAYREYLPRISRLADGSLRYRMDAETITNQHLSLFIFPYDWRVSNSQTARDLELYIADIKRITGTGHVDILAHSMGGLVAGRYFLNGGHRNVTNCITIGSPLLGTPVAYKRLLDGGFYGVLGGAVDYFTDPAIKEVLRGFPAFHELFPSPDYFKLQPRPIMTGVGFDHAEGPAGVELNRQQIRDFFDARYPENRPVAVNELFHTPAQDNWSGLPASLRVLHFVGVQANANTVGRIQVVRRNWLSRQFHDEPMAYDPMLTVGDGTVAFDSAYRTPALRAPSTDTCLIVSDDASVHDYSDAGSEHTGMTMNRRVHAHLLSWLRTGHTLESSATQPAFAPAVAGPPGSTGPSRRVLQVSFGDIESILTPAGPLTRVEANRPMFLPGGEAITESQDAETIVRYPGAGTYEVTVTPRIGEDSVGFIARSTMDRAGNLTSSARYLEIPVGPTGRVRVRDIDQSHCIVEVDADGDGIFDSSTQPSFNVSGDDAADVFPPRVSLTRICRDGKPCLQLSAIDDAHGAIATGVHAIRFTPSGLAPVGPQLIATYIEPIPVTTNFTSRIGVLAVDRAGNQGGGAFDVLPRLRVLKMGDRVRIAWEKSCWPIEVEAAAPSIGAHWQVMDAPIQDFGSEQGFELPAEHAQYYFRLRLRP